MKLQVSIERSLIPGISSTMIFGIFFLIFFFGQMILFLNLPVENPKLDDLLPIIALCSSAILSSLIIYIDEKCHGSTQLLQIEFHKDHITLCQERKKLQIPITEIKEAVRIMRFDRIYPEKGKYKIVIKRWKHRSLTFMTTHQEYENHVDFENTDLSKLYDALRSHGIKCC